MKELFNRISIIRSERDHSGFIRILIAVTVLATSVFATPAPAQSSGSDLRRENQQLRTKVRELEAELAAAQTRADDLERAILALQNKRAGSVRGTGGTGTIPSPDLPVSIDESKANASPRALLKAVRDSYVEAIVDQEMGKADSRQRVTYYNTLKKWRSRVERQFRSRIRWYVKLLEVVPPSTSRRSSAAGAVRVVAVDPITGTELGDAFDFAVPRSMTARLDFILRGNDDEIFVIKGLLTPHVYFNTDREQAGSFDKPRFIGPFAELNFTVEVNAVMNVDEAKKEEERNARRQEHAPKQEDTQEQK